MFLTSKTALNNSAIKIGNILSVQKALDDKGNDVCIVIEFNLDCDNFFFDYASMEDRDAAFEEILAKLEK